MPEIGRFHPQIVHFVVASLFIGLPVYLLGFMRRPRYFRPMAAILLLIGTSAAWFAVRSGLEAHELAEGIPGVGQAVRTHEDLGKDTRNLFGVVLLVELLAIGAAWRMGQLGKGDPSKTPTSALRHVPNALRVVVAGMWVWGCVVLFEAAEHGGDLVYSYAGGVGMRTGNPQDVSHLLMAGLFNQSRLDRKNGDHAGAANLVDEMVAQFPDDPDVAMLKIESLIVDRQDGRAALDALAALPASDNPRARFRLTLYKSDAYALLSMPDSARAALQALPERFQQSRSVTQRLERLGG